MATTISGTSITFNDSSVQSSNAIISTADALAGQLGSYAYLNYVGNTAVRSPGFTIAGSSLTYAGQAGETTSSGAPSGSWRLMGRIGGTYTVGKGVGYANASVWLRYA